MQRTALLVGNSDGIGLATTKRLLASSPENTVLNPSRTRPGATGSLRNSDLYDAVLPTATPHDPLEILTRRRNYSWALSMMRVFLVDVLECPSCGGAMKILCRHPATGYDAENT